MKLYNQSKNPLRWKIGMTQFTCEPWGEVDVQDMFVEHCKARGLPLGVSPVAPEVKADVALANANELARRDEILALQHELALARASEGTAKLEVEKIARELSDEKTAKLVLSADLADTKRKHEALVAEHVALNQLLEEQAKATAAEKLARERAEATVTELKKTGQEAKPAKK